jgi:cardiolipin synthase
VLITHWLIVLGLSLRVISRRSPVGVASAWLVIIFSLPFVGAVLYLLFGEKRLGRGRVARTRAHLPDMQAWQGGLGHVSVDSLASVPAAGALASLARGLYGFPVQAGQSLTLLDNYPAIFDAIVPKSDVTWPSISGMAKAARWM